MKAIPGVTAISATNPIPLAGTENSGRYGPPAALGDETLYGQADYRTVLPGYFETMGTALVDGRLFDAVDHRDSASIAIVDRKLAEKLWPGKTAVGERILIRIQTLEPVFVQVVGVVEHQRSAGVGAEGPETIYLTNKYAGTLGDLYWVVRTSLDAEGLIPQVRTLMKEMDGRIPVADVRTMSDRVNEAMTGNRFALVLISVFGTIALVLAAIGIYGVLAFTVRQRTGEIGVRMALGADPWNILRLIVRQGLTLTGVGIVAGLVAGFMTTRLLGSLLVGVRPDDPPTFAAMTTLFLLVAAGACWVPARRATLVDPSVALRDEGE
jgi:putative ABC transport system permease protein